MIDIAAKRELSLERALGLVEHWADWQGHPAQGPRTARDLLAAWGALARLYRPEDFPPEAAPLTDLLRRDAEVVLAAAARAFAGAAWLEQAQELNAAVDFAIDPEAIRELELAAVTLFDELDRSSLAVCMAARLTPEGVTAEPWAAWRRQLTEAEDWFADHVDAFLPAAPLAGATLAACRPGLEEDEALWQTVLKHRLLEETAEELEADPLFPHLLPTALSTIKQRAGEAVLRTSDYATGASPDWPVYERGIAAAAARNGCKTYECLQPQHQYKAMFDLADPNQQPQVVVSFYRGGHRADDLAGQTVRLRGIPATIDGQGRAQFPRAALEAQAGPVLLEVGEPPVTWPILNDPQ